MMNHRTLNAGIDLISANIGEIGDPRAFQRFVEPFVESAVVLVNDFFHYLDILEPIQMPRVAVEA